MDIYLPVTKGEQAGATTFSAMVSYKELSEVFIFDDSDMPVEMRQQRDINEKRASNFAKYMTENQASYVTGSLTGTYDDQVEFIPLHNPFARGKLGVLRIPATAKITLADGQHRQRGIKEYFESNPDSADESIPVKLYFANDVKRKQQIFADINGHSVKPSSSLSITFDHRGVLNAFVKEVLDAVPEFKQRVEMGQNSVGKNSNKLWPMTAVKKMLGYLLGMSEKSFAKEVQDTQSRDTLNFICTRFISSLNALPQWDDMLAGNVNYTELRQEHIVGHSVFLEALGVYGNTLLLNFDERGEADWMIMDRLADIDTTKHSDNWRGRCVNINGTMNKTVYGVKTTAARLCQLTDIETTEELEQFEQRVAASIAPENPQSEEA